MAPDATKHSPCPICFNDEDSHSLFITLPCNCKACADCLTQWITLKISENHYTIDSKTTCIMANCKKELCLEEIYHKVPPQSQQKIDEALLQVYFSKEKDVRKCPNTNCKFAGVIDIKSSCTSPLQCDLCGTQWRDKQHYTFMEKTQDWLKNTSKFQALDPSENWIKKITKKCPSCKVNIEKNGGCDHMTCKKCNYHFCWVCRWGSPGHNPIVHLYRQYLPFFIAGLIIFSLIVYAIYYFGMMPVIKFFVSNFFWAFYKVICSFFWVAYYFVYGICYITYYVIWNYGISILNFIITNALVIILLRMLTDFRFPRAKRIKFLLGISAFVAVSIYTGYFSIMLGILKAEFFLLLLGGVGLLAVIGCSRRKRGYRY